MSAYSYAGSAERRGTWSPADRARPPDARATRRRPRLRVSGGPSNPYSYPYSYTYSCTCTSTCRSPRDQPFIGGIDDQLARLAHDLPVPGEDHQGIRLDREEIGLVAAQLDEAGGGLDVGGLEVPDAGEREAQRLAGGADLVHDQDAAAGRFPWRGGEDLRLGAHAVAARVAADLHGREV